MSTFESKTSDNFIFDECIEPRGQDSLSTPFLRKNVSYVVDQQAGNGSYTSGEVIIDSQSIAASGNNTDWRNAYLVVPKQTKVEFATATESLKASNASTNIHLIAALKNNAQIDTLKVEANGKTIITATQGLANLVNIKMLSTMTQDQLKKDGAIVNFYPDDVGQVGTATTSFNAANKTTATGDLVYGANRGLIERQQNWLPITETTFMSATNRKDEGMIRNTATAAIDTSTDLSANTAITILDLHYLVVIRLRDLADYFDKHPISRGVSYRFTIKFNQAATSCVFGTGTTPLANLPTSISTSQTSGSAMPSMLCVGPNAAPTITLTTGGVATITITDKIDTTDPTFSGVRLYVPSYELEPSHQEKLLSTNPVVKRNFMDFLVQTTQTAISAGGFFNVQVSTSCTNPRALIVIPRWGQTDQGYFSDASPLSTVPGTTDGLLSLKNLQVKVGSNYVLPDRLFYNYQVFQDHLRAIFAENGGETGRTSGLISKRMFEANHRYYCFDLSRYPEAMTNLPQMVSVEGNSNCQKPVELLCILLYGREAEFNLAQGSLTITA